MKKAKCNQYVVYSICMITHNSERAQRKICFRNVLSLGYTIGVYIIHYTGVYIIHNIIYRHKAIGNRPEENTATYLTKVKLFTVYYIRIYMNISSSKY